MAKVVVGEEHKLSPQAWTEAFREKPADAFEQAFAEDVVLEASVLVRPIVGIGLVKTVTAAACGIYEASMFTQKTTHGPRTYIEWKAEALGNVEFLGVMVLTKNDEGKITRIRLSAQTTPTRTGRSQLFSPGNWPLSEASTRREMVTQKAACREEDLAWRKS